jgi:hypothetical protein
MVMTPSGEQSAPGNRSASASQSRPESLSEQHDARAVTALEERIAVLERQVATLVVAVDMASRMRIATPDHDIRIVDLRVVGGKKVRRALEKGGLVNGYPEVPGID